MTKESKQAASSPADPVQQRRQQMRFWFSTTTAVLGLLYLVAVLLRDANAPRLGIAEGIIFAAVLLVGSGFLDRIASLSISGAGIQLQVQEVERKVEQQKDEIRTLQWLISYFASDAELEHLQRLAADGPALCNCATQADLVKMREELRALCNRGLLARREGKKIADLKQQDDLKSWFVLQRRGKEYLLLRQED